MKNDDARDEMKDIKTHMVCTVNEIRVKLSFLNISTCN